MNLLRTPILFAFFLFIGATASAQDADQSAPTQKYDFKAAIRGGLVDPAAPIEHRRELANQLIEVADRENRPELLYLVGTLYRQGDADGVAPFPKDIDRARDYLTRAALGGYLEAIAKLAILEVDSGDRFRANLWAQLYVHYSALDNPASTATPSAPRTPTGNDRKAAALLELTLDGFPRSDVPRLMERANAMVERYDSTIRAFLKAAKEERQEASFPKTSPRTATQYQPTQLIYRLGRTVKLATAEYFVEFAVDGHLLNAWPFDAWPEHDVAIALRPIVNGYVLDPAPAGTTENRVVIIPVQFVNPNFRPRKDDEKK